MHSILAFLATAILTTVAVITPSWGAESARLCAGGAKGNYFYAGSEIAKQARGALDVKVIETNGSMDNLRRMDAGECDIAFVQSDAYGIYKDKNPSSALSLIRVAAPYKEFAHLLCSTKAGIDEVKDLRGKKGVKVLTGDAESGSEVSWFTWIKMDKDYGTVATDRVGGTQAALRVADGTEAQCSLFIAGLKAPLMNQINDMVGDRVKLVPVKDGDFASVKDPAGKPVYAYSDIPGGTYKNIQHGFFSSSVKTLTVDALVVARTDFAERKGAMDALAEAIMRATPSIRQRVGG